MQVASQGGILRALTQTDYADRVQVRRSYKFRAYPTRPQEGRAGAGCLLAMASASSACAARSSAMHALSMVGGLVGAGGWRAGGRPPGRAGCRRLD